MQPSLNQIAAAQISTQRLEQRFLSRELIVHGEQQVSLGINLLTQGGQGGRDSLSALQQGRQVVAQR